MPTKFAYKIPVRLVANVELEVFAESREDAVRLVRDEMLDKQVLQSAATAIVHGGSLETEIV
jgi:hypothetical protein